MFQKFIPSDGSFCRSPRREKDIAWWWTLACKLVFGFSLTLACQSALAQAMYRIRPLGWVNGCTQIGPRVSGLNNADEVAGYACNGLGDGIHDGFVAFLWKNDGTPMVDLGPDQAGFYSSAAAINASGLIAGSGKDAKGPFVFVSSGDGTPMRKTYATGGASTIAVSGLNDLGQVVGTAWTNLGVRAFVWNGDASPTRDLGTLGGEYDSQGRAINASGQITGVADFTADGEIVHAFIWKNDGTPMFDLGTLGGPSIGAVFINAYGQVAGDSKMPGNGSRRHAFLWRNDGTPMEDLGALGGSFSIANALNDSGQIAGFAVTKTGTSHAFVWMNDGTHMKDLGTLGGTKSYGYAINSSGQVTGLAYLAGDTDSHAFLWRHDRTKMQDLNTLVDPLDPLKAYVTLTDAERINDHGDIVAYGTDSRTGLEGAYLLQGTVLTLSPRSLAFGSQRINTATVAKSVTMTNTSLKVVAITSIKMSGTGALQFHFTNNCGSSLVGHATCTIQVTFQPTTKGAKSATLSVNGGGGGLRLVTLTGTGS